MQELHSIDRIRIVLALLILPADFWQTWRCSKIVWTNSTMSMIVTAYRQPAAMATRPCLRDRQMLLQWHCPIAIVQIEEFVFPWCKNKVTVIGSIDLPHLTWWWCYRGAVLCPGTKETTTYVDLRLSIDRVPVTVQHTDEKSSIFQYSSHFHSETSLVVFVED